MGQLSSVIGLALLLTTAQIWLILLSVPCKQLFAAASEAWQALHMIVYLVVVFVAMVSLPA